MRSSLSDWLDGHQVEIHVVWQFDRVHDRFRDILREERVRHVLVHRVGTLLVAAEPDEGELVGLHHAGGNLEYTDGFARQLESQHTDQRVSCKFRRVVAATTLVGDVAGNGRDREDVRDSAVERTRAEQRKERARHALDANDVDVEHARPVIRVAVFDRSHSERTTGVVHEGVDVADPAEVVPQRIDIVLHREVGDVSLRAGLFGERAKPILAPSDSDDVPAVLPKQANCRRSDSRTRTGHHYAIVGHSPNLPGLRICLRAGRTGPQGPPYSTARLNGMSVTASIPLAQPAARKQRVPLWDNARWASITLVVIGHGIQRLTKSDYAFDLYLFIYAFHMPAFAIISGYFSKATPPGRRQMVKLVTDILIPYLILQAIWSLVQFLAEGKKSFDPAEPHWTLWFLVALAIFRVALPYLVLLRWPLAWAIVFSVGVGYLTSVDSTFSLSRAISLLPFFLLGWYLRKWRLVDRWRVLRTGVWGFRAAAIAIFAVWAVAVFTFVKQFRAFGLQNWFLYDESYAGLGDVEWWSGFVRLGTIALALLLSFCFFALIPRRMTWFTDFGKATMHVYLLHSFVLYPLRETGVLKGSHSSAMWLLSMVLACTAISIALSSPLVRTIFRPLIEPKPLWLFTKDEQPGIVSGEVGAHPPTVPVRRPTPSDAKVSRVDPTGSRRN